jgi:hypothetical protein
MEGGRFPHTYKKYVDPLLKVNGIIQGKNINIAICPTARKNHINVGLANQLMVFESNIIENDMCLSNEKYDIKNLQLSMGDYKFIAQFNVVSIYGDSVDIILGSTWVDTLGTFIFNTRRKFLTFSYKKKKFTLQDATMKSISEAPSSEDLKDISEVILPDNQKSIQKLQDRQEECDKIIIEKDEEISRLRNHNQKLLAKIMKSKEKKRCFQKFEQENQGLKEKLTEKEEESSCLRNLNQKLLEQIKSLKDERRENLESKNKDDKSEDKEELLRLKRHNQDLLTQIKRLKHDKKSLQEELDHKTSIIDKETMTEPMELKKSLDVKVSILDKGINIEPINLTTQKDVNPIDVKRSSNVEEETIQGHEENSIPKVNQQKAISIRSKDQVARMPYQHPNHKNRYFSQSLYQQKQMTSMSKNITSATSDAQNRSYHGSRNTSSSFQEPYKLPMQKIELGWADSFTMRQFCSALKRSYRLRSSTITNSIMKNHATIITS